MITCYHITTQLTKISKLKFSYLHLNNHVTRQIEIIDNKSSYRKQVILNLLHKLWSNCIFPMLNNRYFI